MLCFHPGNLRSQNCTVRTIHRRYTHLSILQPPSGSWRDHSDCVCMFPSCLQVCCAFQYAHNAHGCSTCQTIEKSAATWLPSCPRPSNLHKYPLTGGSEKSCLESGHASEKATASFSTLNCRQAREEDSVRTVERVSLQ